MKLNFNIFVSALLLVPAGHLLGEPSNAWQEQAGATVDGSGIFLGQLVKNPTSPVPLLRLAPAPPWGQTNVLTREQIIELARSQYPEVETTNWTGPEQTEIRRRGRQLLDFQLLELLTPALQRTYSKNSGDLEIRLAQPWKPPQVPDEALTLKITELPMDGLLPNCMVGFELWDGKDFVGTWRIDVLAKLWRDVPVARSPLLRGQLLRDADIGLERRDVLARRESYVNLATADASAELNENILVGQPVLRRAVRERPAIRRGQIVDAVYADGALKILLKVVTLDEGAIGQQVRVRNPKTNHELTGTVQNEDTILITL